MTGLDYSTYDNIHCDFVLHNLYHSGTANTNNDKKYENKEDYYQRYIKKLKYIIDEKDVEYWNIKKSSFFVGFKKFW